MKQKKKEKKVNNEFKKKINITSIIIFFMFLICYIILLVSIFRLNMLPSKIMFIVILLSIVLLSIFSFLIFKKKIKWKIKVVCDIILVLFTIGFLFANHYIVHTIDFLNDITNNKEEIVNYYVLALKSSNINGKEDLNNKKIAYVSGLGDNDEAIEKLQDEIKFNMVKSNSIISLANSLLAKENELILLASYHKEMLSEEIENFDESIKIVYEFSIKKISKVEANETNVIKDSFNVFLSGIDTYGDIGSISRSDVNMLVTINPQTYQILLTSIPRDYYVPLSCANGAMDKLTHAGIYGVDCSIGTLENLFDTKINYYMRVNFSSLINIVDVLGGVSVYSDYTFNTYGYQFYSGYNDVNGDYALAFSRARYNFEDGDRQRGKNQQAVIKAIINKALTPEILGKYTNILDVLKNSFQTNFDTLDIQKIAKFQIDKSPKWQIYTIGVNGFDDSKTTYSCGEQILYVMQPDQNTIDEAKTTISKIMKGQEVDAKASVVSGSNQNVNTKKITSQNVMTTALTKNETTTSTTTTSSTKTTNIQTTLPTTTTTTVVQTIVPITTVNQQENNKDDDNKNDNLDNNNQDKKDDDNQNNDE